MIGQGGTSWDLRTIRPLNFQQFLYAIGEDQLADYLAEIAQTKNTIHDIHNSQIIFEFFKVYLITGGLPIAISKFIKFREQPLRAYREVRKTQYILIENYITDFLLCPNNINSKHIFNVFNAIPLQLAKRDHTHKFIFTDVISKGNRSHSDISPSIKWLKVIGLALEVIQIRAPNMPKLKHGNIANFKLFLADVGLLGAMAHLKPESIVNLDINTCTGYLIENFLLQELHFHQFYSIDTWLSRSANIDFIANFIFNDIQIPIEINNGLNKKDKSLQSYIYHHAPPLSLRFGGSDIIFDHQKKIYHFPIFLTSSVLHRLIQRAI